MKLLGFEDTLVRKHYCLVAIHYLIKATVPFKNTGLPI